jgi:hypothetical protein
MSMAAPDYLKSRSRQARLQHYAHMDRNDDFRSVASPRDNLLLRAGRALAGFEDAIRLDYAVYARGVTARGRIHEADFQVAIRVGDTTVSAGDFIQRIASLRPD